MSIQAWQVITWAPHRVPLTEWSVISARLRHLGTSVYVDERGGASPHGQVLWGAEHDDHMLGVAWNWGQVMPGVAAMSDPMALLSNIVLVDADGDVLPDSARTLQLNRAIYRLDWQRSVLALHRREPPAIDADATPRLAAAAPQPVVP